MKTGVFHLYSHKRIVILELSNIHWAGTRDSYLAEVDRTI